MTITDPFADVVAWHKRFQIPCPDLPEIPSDEQLTLRDTLLQEELDEFREAWDELATVSRAPEAQEERDALIARVAHEGLDVVMVVLGTLVTFGIPTAAVWHELMRSLNTKTPGVERADGKIVKGPNYEPPNVAYVIATETTWALRRVDDLTCTCETCGGEGEVCAFTADGDEFDLPCPNCQQKEPR